MTKLDREQAEFVMNFGDRDRPDRIGRVWRGVGRQGGTGGVATYDDEVVSNDQIKSQGYDANQLLGHGPKAVFTQVYRGGRHFYVDEKGKEVKLNF